VILIPHITQVAYVGRQTRPFMRARFRNSSHLVHYFPFLGSVLFLGGVVLLILGSCFPPVLMLVFVATWLVVGAFHFRSLGLGCVQLPPLLALRHRAHRSAIAIGWMPGDSGGDVVRS
jgi:hypothetical protein